jgi:hypothetical protein
LKINSEHSKGQFGRVRDGALWYVVDGLRRGCLTSGGVRTLSSADTPISYQKEFRRVDLYRLLSAPAPDAVTPVEVATSPRDTGMPGMTDPRSRPTTQFTESIESTDEERSGALLGSVAP